ncbi:MAG: hypothetical protein J5771_06725 [Bacteroidales bacterium]|nr:hypothetical protein [Bacteroidales bacterium]
MPDLPVSIRLNPFKGPDGPDGAPVPWSPWGRILSGRPNFTLDPLFHAGCYYVQDSSAMFVGHLFRKYLPKLDFPRVLDLCAAPGGKTTDLAASLRERCGDAFELIANEVMAKRARVLADNVAAWGDANVKVCSVDPSVIGRELPGYFDVIVADVPCSGEGMFRKDPRAEAEWSPAVVELCAARQKRILADVWPALREGGLLIYSTCTYEDAENDANLRWAAETLGGEIIPPEDEFGAYGVRLTSCGSLLKAGEVPGEGQWAGALVKTVPSPGRPSAALSGALPLMYPADAVRRSSNPSGVSEPPRVELTLEQAQRYLHRDSFPLPDAPLGMITVCYRGHPLGLAKNLGKRINNLYPKNRRILMDV